MPPALVIFDCDGVLVDSEHITNRVLADFLNRHGADLTAQSCHDLFAGTSRSAVETYMARNGTPLAPDWSHDIYPNVYAALEAEVTAIDGVAAMLETLTGAGVPVCVASNGMAAKMELTLGRTGLLGYFGTALYSAYDIGASKPAPDVFLHAAHVHKVTAQDCVVIEDSASGFEAAARANMRCLGYAPAGPIAHRTLYGAQPFAQMAHLPGLLGL